MRALVSEGAAQGAFDVVDIEMTVDLLHQTWRMRWVVLAEARRQSFAGDAAGAQAMVEARLQLEERMTTRLLGCGSTPVRLPAPEEFAGFLQAA